ncbi:MAG: T9SS type A sorting domain-containing protein [Ignavibacteria bacterium]|nr:T9SS type A sorting domain-containing protein [Ignavibacteria bacterium]
MNNKGFDIERSAKSGSWQKIGYVKGIGSSNVPTAYTYKDKSLKSGNYEYRLKQIDFNGDFNYYELSNAVTIGNPNSFLLMQNYPNPFNPVTTIRYEIQQSANVSLKIFDMTGREIMTLVDEFKEAGYYKTDFNGGNLSSGAYYYRLEVIPSNSFGAGDFVDTKKMLLLK